MARQNFVGLVVSQGKMHKTVKVRVQTKFHDPKIHKDVLRRKDYLVHDEGNLCKEGDIVRIEAIPKISARKYFAIAEIKVDKGQQFALYEKVAKEKVAEEEKGMVREFMERRESVQQVITKIDDLKSLDTIANKFQSDPEADRESLINQINEIKEKYNIKSWPTEEPVLQLEINLDAINLQEYDNRKAYINQILDKLMSEKYTETRNEILAKVSKKQVDQIKPNIQKNLLRKYVMNPENEVPVSFV